MIIYLGLLQILSCQKSKEIANKKLTSFSSCDSSFVDGIYYKEKFIILTLSCGIFEYDKNLRKINSYNFYGKFSISNDSLFLISKSKIYFYDGKSFIQVREKTGIIGYVNGFYLFKNGIFRNNDTIKIPEIETYKFYKNKLIIGTNGYGLYIIENSKVKHFILGKLPSNFIKSISIYKDTIIIGFSEPFSKSKVGFFYQDRIIKVFEFSEDYITDIYSSDKLFIGTSNGLFEYKDGEFHKILDGYISRILHFESENLFLILNSKIKKLKLS
ncbi:MAG: hypothetical protein ABIL52_03285 [candidate division WOR-3 bacterium]